MSKSVAERKAELEAKRAARHEEHNAAAEEQYVNDLEKVDELEQLHGVSNITVLRVPYSPGLPVLVIGRCPKQIEVKRFRSRVKPNDKESQQAAAVEIAMACLLYPDRETFAKLVEARGGIDHQLGAKCVELAVAVSEAEGKD